MPNGAVTLDQVWKRYRLGQGVSLFRRRNEADDFWALRDLSFSMEPGESVGLIGHNGAGKTTTLKLLAGISKPTRGTLSAAGRVASLINLGAGFHRELTGRENVFLNGVILGLTRQEVKRRFDEIVEFADLGAYIDTPVKQYSSGMYARLGFSVAAHVDADVLLVDEVLSVGDVGFQDRSIRKMLSFQEQGRSVVFVSHNLSAVEMMCQRAVWLEHGQVRLAGATSEVVSAYLDSVDHAALQTSNEIDFDDEHAAVSVEQASTLRGDGQLATDFDYGDPLQVRLHCVAREQLQDVRATVTIRGDYGPLFSADTESDAHLLGNWEPGPHTLTCRFDALPLLPGLYRIEVSLRHAREEVAKPPRSVAAFRVTTDLASYGSTSPVGETKSRGGFLAVPYDWQLETAQGSQRLAGLVAPATRS